MPKLIRLALNFEDEVSPRKPLPVMVSHMTERLWQPLKYECA